ncbi:cytochrome P450 [Amycolatopsis japonica]
MFAKPEAASNVYPHYEILRQNCPIFRSREGFWIVSGYAECEKLLRDRRLGMDSVALNLAWPYSEKIVSPENSRNRSGRSFHSLNPPAHTKLRQFFTVEMNKFLRSYDFAKMASVVADAIAKEANNREFCALEQLASPIVKKILGNFFAIPDEDGTALFELLIEKHRGLEPARSLSIAARSVKAKAKVEDYFAEILEDREAVAEEDCLLRRLIQANDYEGRPFDNKEMAANSALLYGAGTETTVQFLCSAVSNLSRSSWPTREWPHTDASVAELNRIDTSTHLVARVALDDFDFGQHRIRRGHTVMFLLASANRDSRQFSSPDTLLIDRAEGPGLGFGWGIHRCPGARLAGKITQMTISGLANSGLEISVPMDLVAKRITIRGYDSLPVRANRIEGSV